MLTWRKLSLSNTKTNLSENLSRLCSSLLQSRNLPSQMVHSIKDHGVLSMLPTTEFTWSVKLAYWSFLSYSSPYFAYQSYENIFKFPWWGGRLSAGVITPHLAWREKKVFQDERTWSYKKRMIFCTKILSWNKSVSGHFHLIQYVKSDKLLFGL